MESGGQYPTSHFVSRRSNHAVVVLWLMDVDLDLAQNTSQGNFGQAGLVVPQLEELVNGLPQCDT